jgi:hypothetical protein
MYIFGLVENKYISLEDTMADMLEDNGHSQYAVSKWPHLLPGLHKPLLTILTTASC